MRCATIQMGKWRKCPEGTTLYDITAKSGERAFAPTWDLLRRYKASEIDDLQYSYEYHAQMQESFKRNRKIWMDLVNMDSVALACYCPANQFCHRLLLKSYLEKLCRHLGITFEDVGEIK